jgi:hypothetical protein
VIVDVVVVVVAVVVQVAQDKSYARGSARVSVSARSVAVIVPQ